MTILAAFNQKNFIFGQNDQNDQNGEKGYNAPWFFARAGGSFLSKITKIFKIFRFEKLSLAFVCHLTLLARLGVKIPGRNFGHFWHFGGQNVARNGQT